MQVRYSPDPICFRRMTTDELRGNFLIEDLFGSGQICMVYCDVDRAIVGSAVPGGRALELASADELRAEYFAQRRELGVINIGARGGITVDGKEYRIENRDVLYIGRGAKRISFAGDGAAFYLVSYPAHKEYPTAHIPKADASAAELGSEEACNKRTIYKYIHPDGAASCQLVMGYTELAPGCVWNTMPPHTHERRMEVYMYFDLAEDDRVFHLMGKPDQTRHIVVANRQAVVSPSWSIHAGVGTGQYAFCWAMGGENQAFDDMDKADIGELR